MFILARLLCDDIFHNIVYGFIKAKTANQVFLPSGCQIVLCRQQQWAPLYPTIDGQNLVVGHGFKPKKKLNCVI